MRSSFGVTCSALQLEARPWPRTPPGTPAARRPSTGPTRSTGIAPRLSKAPVGSLVEQQPGRPVLQPREARARRGGEAEQLLRASPRWKRGAGCGASAPCGAPPAAASREGCSVFSLIAPAPPAAATRRPPRGRPRAAAHRGSPRRATAAPPPPRMRSGAPTSWRFTWGAAREASPSEAVHRHHRRRDRRPHREPGGHRAADQRHHVQRRRLGGHDTRPAAPTPKPRTSPERTMRQQPSRHHQRDEQLVEPVAGGRLAASRPPAGSPPPRCRGRGR